MSCRIAFICGRQGLSILPMLADLAGTGNFRAFVSPAAWTEQGDEAAPGAIAPITSPGDLHGELEQFRPDVIFVMTYLSKIDPDLGALATFGMVNIHPSLLPQYRGGAPVFYALKNDETQTGVSYHFMTEDFDQGPIIHQAAVKIGPADCASSVWLKIVKKIFVTLPDLVASRHDWRGMAREQDEAAASHVGFPTPRERMVGTDRTVAENLAIVRACGSTVGARLDLDGKHVFVTRASAATGLEPLRPGFLPLVRVRDGWLRIDEALIAGAPVTAPSGA
jgi:methionyl-tRNA formyltransferase